MDNVENIIVVLVVVDLTQFRSNAQKRLTRTVVIRRAPLGADGDRRGESSGW
jgi:hypothetical protein